MTSFLPNALGALLGIFLALLAVTRLAGYIPTFWNEPPTEDARPSLERVLPPDMVSYIKEGIPDALLLGLTEKDAPPPEDALVTEDSLPPQKTAEKSEEKKPVPFAPTPLPATELNTLARNATVNIFCTLNGGIDALSGSGVFIDPRGIILTNAHIAQYFLLDTRDSREFITCNIRTGSPAERAYAGELLYLPSEWIEAHAEDIGESDRADTGEHDYALVRAVPPEGTATSSFPSLVPAYGGGGAGGGGPVLIASYPAGFLDSETIYKNLWQVSTITAVREIYSFSSSTLGYIEVFSVPGVIGAQEGSSGGAAVRASDGMLLGLIVTRSKGETTGERNLFSLTIPYINADIAKDLEKSLEEFLASDIDGYQDWFNASVRPRLKERLLGALGR